MYMAFLYSIIRKHRIDRLLIGSFGIDEVDLGLAPGKQPDYSADYQNDQEYSRPDSGLENVSDYFTATQGQSR
jgi:hypothetical protein